ncbi:predicted protein [Naegleria gruberi]|uniref:Predicted protein n=1 Tax=Naegleria gruberi TaxID=5762 RepID=D2UYX5_NAEGR|nr:uncharacterized protein NAEGRDRAFT_29844 [Naegleria gruberi]EFC50046.1 predicted protein [Naegleria gruberi]|eukprot:XP_002682790.1 predicted protein [Naegleria gruberi strain NEG-M]
MFDYFSSLAEQVSQTVTQNGNQLIELYKKDIDEFADAVSVGIVKINELASELGDSDQSSSNISIENILYNEQSYKTPIYLSDENDLNTIQIDIDSKTDEISKLLENDPKLKEIHTNIVPSQISFILFWKRYYQLKLNFEENEKKRKLFESLNNTNTKNESVKEHLYLDVLKDILNDDFNSVQEIRDYIKMQLGSEVLSLNETTLATNDTTLEVNSDNIVAASGDATTSDNATSAAQNDEDDDWE